MTSIGEEHLEGLGSLEGVLNEEAAIFQGVDRSRSGEPTGSRARSTIARHAVIEAGLESGEVRPDAWGMGADGRGWATFGDVRLTMRVPGAHNLRNAMLAIAVARACGVPDEAAVDGISKVEPLDMRGRWIPVGGLTVINDAYNANPASMREAITLLDSFDGSRPRVWCWARCGSLGRRRRCSTRRSRSARVLVRCRHRCRDRRLCRAALRREPMPAIAWLPRRMYPILVVVAPRFHAMLSLC